MMRACLTSGRAGLAAAIGAIAMVAVTAAPCFAGTAKSQQRRASDRAPSALAQMRLSCPILGEIVEAFAMQDLGEAVPRAPWHPRVAAGPIVGDRASIARQAREARNAGATLRDFEASLYLTAVTAGVPQAVAATQVLLRVFEDRESQCIELPPSS